MYLPILNSWISMWVAGSTPQLGNGTFSCCPKRLNVAMLGLSVGQTRLGEKGSYEKQI